MCQPHAGWVFYRVQLLSLPLSLWSTLRVTYSLENICEMIVFFLSLFLF